MALMPFVRPALPVAFKIIRTAMKAGTGVPISTGARGWVTRALEVIGAVGIFEIARDFMGGDTEGAETVERLVLELEAMMTNGGILIPEPRRGESQEMLFNQLNYFTINSDKGHIWATDNYNSKKTVQAAYRRGFRDGQRHGGFVNRRNNQRTPRRSS